MLADKHNALHITPRKMEYTKEHATDDSEAHSLKESIDSHPHSTATSNHIDDPNNGEAIVYPTTAKLVLILTAAALSIFLVALDTSIISTAIPQITDDFHSLDDVAW